MGHLKADALSAGLEYSEVSKLELGTNMMSSLNGKNIISRLGRQVIELNLENNELGKSDEFSDALAKHIIGGRFILQGLNLSQNYITDQQVHSICSALGTKNNHTLKKLKLSKNLLTVKAAKSIRDLFINSSTKLCELDLSWNNIWAKGGAAIAQILKEDLSLRVVDLSWNCIGRGLQQGEVGE